MNKKSAYIERKIHYHGFGDWIGCNGGTGGGTGGGDMDPFAGDVAEEEGRRREDELEEEARGGEHEQRRRGAEAVVYQLLKRHSNKDGSRVRTDVPGAAARSSTASSIWHRVVLFGHWLARSCADHQRSCTHLIIVIRLIC
jgi:hypothetical protein